MSNSKTSLIIPVFSLERISTLSYSRVGNPTSGKPIQFILRKPATFLGQIYQPISEGLIIDTKVGERYEISHQSEVRQIDFVDRNPINALIIEQVTSTGATITQLFGNSHVQRKDFLSFLSLTEPHTLSSSVDPNTKIIHPIIRLLLNVNVEVVFPAVAHSAYRIAYADNISCGQAIFEVAGCMLNPENPKKISVAFRYATLGLTTAQINDTKVKIAQMSKLKPETIVLSDGAAIEFQIIDSYENGHPPVILAGTNYESFGRMAFNINL